MTRKIKLQNDKLKGYLEDNKKLSEEINEIVEDWKKKDEYVKKLSTKMERIKERIRPLVADEIKKLTKLEEFEMVAGTKLNKGNIEVEILDQVELYKEHLRKQNEDNTKKTGEHKESGEGKKEEKKN